MNIENVEEKYEDVLQNIEFAIVQTYRQQPQLIDFEVDQAVEALVRSYTAELLQRPPSPPRLKERPCRSMTRPERCVNGGWGAIRWKQCRANRYQLRHRP